jgi:hypothetical protein
MSKMNKIVVFTFALFLFQLSHASCSIDLSTEQSYNFHLIVQYNSLAFSQLLIVDKDSIIQVKKDDIKLLKYDYHKRILECNIKYEHIEMKIRINKNGNKLIINNRKYKILPINWDC